VHIVTYQCEHCLATHTRPAGERTDGMCANCGYPMKIEDLFGDRRFVSVPVQADRRDSDADEAA
jgi:hypothetical protein